jgi:hypothetical protein
MSTELLGPDSPAWSAFLEASPHDFYHLPAYVALSAEERGGEAAALLVRGAEGAMLLPLVIADIPGGGRDAVTPYGYSGPLVSGGGSDLLRDALLEGAERLRAEGLVSLFVRWHPLLGPEPPDGVGTVVRHGDTVVVDLSRSHEELTRETRRDHRAGIRRAEAAGQRVVFDDAWARFDDFLRIYHETMRRVSAEDWYDFGEPYFRGLREALGERLHLVTVDIDGDVAAAGLFVETCGIVEFHLSGTDARYLSAAPTKVLLHAVRAWAKDRGDRWFHLGGGLGAADDSLLLFKAGFSPLRSPFHTLRVVLRPDEYRRLSGDEHADADPGSGFFPRYRRAEGS